MQCKKRGCWDTRERDGEDSLVILEEKRRREMMKTVEMEKQYILEDRNQICKEIATVMGVESDEESRRPSFFLCIAHRSKTARTQPGQQHSQLGANEFHHIIITATFTATKTHCVCQVGIQPTKSKPTDYCKGKLTNAGKKRPTIKKKILTLRFTDNHKREAQYQLKTVADVF